MLLHLAKSQVRPERAVDEPDRTVDRVLSYPMPAVTKSGVVGAPSTASAGSGAELVEQLVGALSDLLRAGRAEQDPDV